MSRSPYLLEDQRFGSRFGDRVAVDSMMRDGLCCPVDGVLMGVHGSDVASELGVRARGAGCLGVPLADALPGGAGGRIVRG